MEFLNLKLRGWLRNKNISLATMSQNTFINCEWFSFLSSVLVSLWYLVRLSLSYLLHASTQHHEWLLQRSCRRKPISWCYIVEEVTQLLLLPNPPCFSQSIQKILYFQGSCLSPLEQPCWTESTEGPSLLRKSRAFVLLCGCFRAPSEWQPCSHLTNFWGFISSPLSVTSLVKVV